MKTDNVNIILSKDIITLRIDSSEWINEKYLDQFIKTNLEQNFIPYDKDTFYYCKYLKESLSYEIMVFNTQNIKDTILEPFLFINYNSDHDTLFICDDFFTLYINNTPVLLKQITNETKDDIELYIAQNYKLLTVNTVIVDKNRYKQMKSDDIDKTILKNINYKKVVTDNSYNVFKTFIAASFIIFCFIFYLQYKAQPISSLNNEVSPYKNQYNQMQTILKQHDQNTINKTIELFKFLKINGIILDAFHYSKDNISISLTHKNKQKLLEFTTLYNQNLAIESLEYLFDNSMYRMKASIKI